MLFGLKLVEYLQRGCQTSPHTNAPANTLTTGNIFCLDDTRPTFIMRTDLQHVVKPQ